jgi:DNA-directed RNA polymerase subunit RPC12/RpoP
MKQDIPIQFRLRSLKHHTLRLAVPRKQVNLFLSILWDELTENIGRMGCQHIYTPTSDPETYAYTVFWCDVSLSFDAEMVFINHTARGLIKMTVAVIDRKNDQEDINLAKKVLHLASESQKRLTQVKPSSPGTLARVPILTALPLNGIYEFIDAVIFPSEEKVDFSDDEECGASVSFLEFWVYSTNSAEIFAEAQEKARDIAASLTLLTQHLFLEQSSKSVFYQPEKLQGRQAIIEQITRGSFVADDGLIEDQIKPNEDGVFDLKENQAVTKDIVEPRDTIIDRTIAFPRRAKQALQYILHNRSLVQASRRFQEALLFQQEMTLHPNRRPLGDLLTPYQIVAFVAAIEALLDTKPKDIEYFCPSCGEKITIKERQINKTFLAFVREYSDNNPLAEKMFREIYEDRSRFLPFA